ncbi:hypothetical protein Y1Q_0007985 [Alligator mississippiensis]|uniref:SCAN box domain-containing protein n=1 Tax=Alligator mississippiensis TaxID=8496 RepID=A0A151NF18_ALLMI|nr:hypothetical protein Y1Q_0007985 [Alligator mississippiensis]
MMQPPIANTPDAFSQNLQLLTQIVDTQQQMLQRQQEWMRPGVLAFKMLRMTSEDDPKAYIEAFERHAILTGLDKVFWAGQLGAFVVGKAQVAYRAMPRDEAWDYDAVKAAMLYRLEINPEHYQRKFWAKKGAEERCPHLLLQLLRNLFGKYINLATCDREAVVDQIILEQFLDDLEGHMQQWVRQHSPSSCEEALKLAEAFVASEGFFPKERRIPAHSAGVVKEVERKKGPVRSPVRDIVCFHCGKTDVSEMAVGAVLTQDDGGVRWPVAYVSRKLLPAETKYSAASCENIAEPEHKTSPTGTGWEEEQRQQKKLTRGADHALNYLQLEDDVTSNRWPAEIKGLAVKRSGGGGSLAGGASWRCRMPELTACTHYGRLKEPGGEPVPEDSITTAGELREREGLTNLQKSGEVVK